MEINVEKEIRSLIKRYALLRYTDQRTYCRLIKEAVDRIQRRYIILTGYEIEDNEECQKLLDFYNNK